MPFSAIEMNSGGTANFSMPWGIAAWPVGATVVVPTCTPQFLFNLSTTATAPSYMAQAHMRFDWTSVAGGGVVTNGTEIAIGQVMPDPGVAATMEVFLRINNKDRLSEVHLSVADIDNLANKVDSMNLQGSLLNNTWFKATLAVNPAGWNNQAIGLCVSIKGTTNPARVGQAILDVGAINYII